MKKLHIYKIILVFIVASFVTQPTIAGKKSGKKSESLSDVSVSASMREINSASDSLPPTPTALGSGSASEQATASFSVPASTSASAPNSIINEAVKNDAADRIKKLLRDHAATKDDKQQLATLKAKKAQQESDAADRIKKLLRDYAATKDSKKQLATLRAERAQKSFISRPITNTPVIEQGNTKAQNYANRVSLVAPQLMALDTITNRMQNEWTNALPGAGEENTPAEIIIPWISSHYGTSRQGKINFIPGYKVNFVGFSVGSDFVVNEKVKLGLSYSNITSKLKVRGNQNADGIKSHTVSVYGQYNFTNDLFTHSAIAYTVGSSKNRPNNLNSYKVSHNGLGGFVTLNKDFSLHTDISVTPRIGLRYIENKEKDTNLGRGNKIKGSKNRYFTGIFGATLSAKKQLTNGTSLKPILYIGLEKNFTTKNKAPMAHVEEAGRPFEYQNITKSQKISYILGTGLSTKCSNLQLSLSYQCSLAKKYVSHHGILKLGLTF